MATTDQQEDRLVGETILITGATGFLGGALVREAARRGASVRALARRPERAAALRDLPGVAVVEGDITHPEQMRAAARGCTLVIHSAAALKGALAQQMAVNRDGTANVMRTAAEAGVRRVVHISTISVYGYKNDGDVTEDTPPNPGSDPYGLSKLAAEQVVQAQGATHSLPYSMVRPGMIYGPESGMWTGQMFRWARRRPTVFIGDGGGSCYAIHVDDVVDLTLLLTTHPAAVGQTFNCAPDPSPTWRAFLSGYARLAGHEAWLGLPPALLWPVAALAGMFAPRSSPLKDLPDLLPFSQRTITYRMTKARHLLGWAPRVPLDEGIARCAHWLRCSGLL